MIENNIIGLIENYKIFIDTSSLMHSACYPFLKNIATTLKKNDNGIIIAEGVKRELLGLQKNSDKDKAQQARNGMELMNYLLKNELGKVYGDPNDGYIDNLFQSLFIKFRNRYNLCLITQDVALMQDIVVLSTSKSVKFIKSIKVYKISQLTIDGKPLCVPFIDYAVQNNKAHQVVKGVLTNKEGNSNIVPFKNSRVVIDKSQFNSITLESVPGAGDILTSEKGIKLKLQRDIASGAEGTIYEFDLINENVSSNKYLCKIFKKGKINNARIEKLKLMISKEVDLDGVCWPLSILYNDNKEIVGYVMKKADGYELQRSLFIPQLRIDKLGGNWTRKYLVLLCTNILRTIKLLHKYNIIIGDINPGNIMVDKHANVFFIDTDSYQIQSYPCPVGSPTFTHPDIINKPFKSFLRKKEHEYFAIATLIFMILVPGKSPFAFQGGSSPAANVKARKFVFPFRSYTKNIKHLSHEIKKDGTWRYIWSHLPHKIKEAFYESFVVGDVRKIDGKHGWMGLMDNYGGLIDKEFVSNELFPTAFKEISEEIKQKYQNKE